jgi:hypothetical protein
MTFLLPSTAFTEPRNIDENLKLHGFLVMFFLLTTQFSGNQDFHCKINFKACHIIKNTCGCPSFV